MRGRQIVLGQIGGRDAAALLVDGRLEDFLLAVPDQPAPGAVYRAVCDRIMGGRGGAMMRLGGGLTGYLPKAEGLEPGQEARVQVTGYAFDGKAVPLQSKLQFKGRYCVVTPEAPGFNLSRKIKGEALRAELKSLAQATADPAFGLIVRSAASEADPAEVAQDIEAQTASAQAALAPGQGPAHLVPGASPRDLALRDWEGAYSGDSLEEAGVLDALEALRSPEVPIGPGRMTIEPTRALVAVDVDTGADTSHAAGLKANLAAAAALPRQLRLRGLGGQVVVDAAPMAKGQRDKVEAALKRSSDAAALALTFVGWTRMGHIECHCRKDRLPLVPRLPKEL